MSTERRSLQMHPRLLWDIITKQAGTLGKAILEGAMNSIDAGATRCEVTIEKDRVVICDDGRGFTSEDEISRFFETFGYPHEKGDAVYGRFRMGRGQMFAFGVNRWASNEFRMTVDVKPQENSVGIEGAGLGYDFSKGHDHHAGCRIEIQLYEPLLPSQIDDLEREVEKHVKWSQIPVSINGRVATKRPEQGKWDEETDDAWIKVTESGSLDVYNLGVLVRSYGTYQFGVGGTVVSKRKLDVNFARNDIQSTCPVWRRISSRLKRDATDKNTRKVSLNDGQRENFVRRLSTGDLPLVRMLDQRVLTDVTGSHHPLRRLISVGTFGNKLAADERSSRLGEGVHNQKVAFVLASNMLDWFGVETVDGFRVKLAELAAAEIAEGGAHWREQCELRNLQAVLENCQVLPREQFSQHVSGDMRQVAQKDLSRAEKVMLDILAVGSWHVVKTLNASGWAERVHGAPLHRREIRLGESHVADAWTDGSRIVWIGRHMLPLAKSGYAGMSRLAALMVHEYLHGEPDTETHQHDVEFYQRFHDMSIDTDIVGDAACAMVQRTLSIMRAEKRRPTGAVRKTEDAMAVLAENEIAVDAAPPPAPEPEVRMAARVSSRRAAPMPQPELPGMKP